MNIKLITAGVLAMTSFAASAQVTLYGGGATLPAQAYVGDKFYVPTNNGNNSNGVSTLGMGADGGYNQQQMQDLINKVDELINALRR